MLKKKCTANFEPTKLVKCDPCRHYYFSRTEAIKLRNGVLIVTLHYDLRTCFQGLGKGSYINSLSLLPGEELEIEIIRRNKYIRELHEATSVETEFEEVYKETTRNKFNVNGEFNFSLKGEGGFKIFGIGAKAETEISSSIKSSYEWFKEIVESTTSSVSTKYDVSIDVKTETENSFRSIRKIRNPNACHPVAFLLSQIMKKYKTELYLLRVEYDFKTKTPPLLAKRNSSIELIKPLLIPFNFFLNKNKLSSSIVKDNKKIKLPTLFGESKSSIQTLPSQYMELTKSDLLSNIRNANSKSEVKRMIELLRRKDEYKAGIKASKEYCIRTSDIHIESRISECSACCQDDC